jgi:uncharacterized protein
MYFCAVMKVRRNIIPNLKKWFFKGKALIIIGARQVGKTTMISNLIKSYNQPYLILNGEEPAVKLMFVNISKENFATIVGNNKILFIDEAQQIKNIGLCLKIMVDNFKDIQIIVSGSSALEIADEIFEPMTGRFIQFNLHPLSFVEVYNKNNFVQAQKKLHWHLVYGLYPDTLNFEADAKVYLMSIANAYLYKDVLTWLDIRKPALLEKLMQLLAYQIGSEVSVHELALKLNTKSETVENYLTLLEKAFVIYRLSSYVTNQRKEVTKMKKVYFWDLGIRNALINNFNPIDARMDVGALWENFLITERLKFLSYNNELYKAFFWRSLQQQEVDYIEKGVDSLHAYEMKWTTNANVKITKAFSNSYPEAITSGITPNNYWPFVNGE